MGNFDEEQAARSLAGSLLVAHPNMLDPNFRRTVLFISEHDPGEGALGVIINRPLERQVADLVTEAPPGGLAEVPVFLGGPVGKNQLMFAAFEWHQSKGLKLNHNVGLEEASDAVDPKKVIKEQEQRVALLPSAASQLTRRGHSVVVQKNAGIGSGYPDEEYVKAGAEIVDQAKEVFMRADMVVKVKEPLEAEFPLLRKGQILFTYLHLAASKSLTEALLKSGVTAVAYETIQINHRLPLLEPMSEIAGRMSAVMGANFLAKYNGGSGVLLAGVPGVLPGRVVVVGGGTSGVNAARIATGLGAEVTILDVDLERLRYLDLAMENTNTLYSSEANLQDFMADCDLLIGAIA